MIRKYLVLGLLLVSPLKGQTPATPAKPDSTKPPNVWASFGPGLGGSDVGPIAGRAALSLALWHALILSYSATSLSGFDHSVGANCVLIGVRTANLNHFVFLSGGVGTRYSDYSQYGSQTAYTVESGFHAGGRLAGIGIDEFLVVASKRTAFGGAVVSLDVGWFGH